MCPCILLWATQKNAWFLRFPPYTQNNWVTAGPIAMSYILHISRKGRCMRELYQNLVTVQIWNQFVLHISFVPVSYNANIWNWRNKSIYSLFFMWGNQSSSISCDRHAKTYTCPKGMEIGPGIEGLERGNALSMELGQHCFLFRSTLFNYYKRNNLVCNWSSLLLANTKERREKQWRLAL